MTAKCLRLLVTSGNECRIAVAAIHRSFVSTVTLGLHRRRANIPVGSADFGIMRNGGEGLELFLKPRQMGCRVPCDPFTICFM